MKNTIKINNWTIGITAVLYLTFFLGIFSQILLGLFQVLVFFKILTKWKEIASRSTKHLLSTYGILTSFLLVFTFIFPDQMIGVLWIGSLGLVAFFTFILYQLKTLELWN
ncbi:hypothetical protein SCB49_04200 [unidentified eubacterium SCB49]|nr:hypothetical protein SCB49_04200 [unidentified eubacterium SCB49]